MASVIVVVRVTSACNASENAISAPTFDVVDESQYQDYRRKCRGSRREKNHGVCSMILARVGFDRIVSVLLWLKRTDGIACLNMK